MRHLFRAGVLLVAVLLFVFVGIRVLPVPEFLADFGFHTRNSEENRELWANLPVQYVSSAICLDCHPANYNLWQKGNHRNVACENCHGPAKEHIGAGAPEVVITSRELCSTCHSRLISRPSNFPQVNTAEMGGDAECITCHNPHEPRAGMPPQVPHELEDRTECASCHAPHEPLAILPPPVPHTLEGRGDCLVCHGPHELRGETLPRPPHGLAGRENCLMCHNPSGIRPLPGDHAGRTSATCFNCHRLD